MNLVLQSSIADGSHECQILLLWLIGHPLSEQLVNIDMNCVNKELLLLAN